MAHYGGSQKARQEQAARRRMYHERLKKTRNSGAYSRINASAFSEWRMRRLAPFVVVINVALLLFALSWLFAQRESKISVSSIKPHENQLAKFEAGRANYIYKFNISQALTPNVSPVYSELEIEILDENYLHVYSVYKDLWQERYLNDEGRNQLYSDKKMEFEVELPKKGTYYIRPITGNESEIGIQVYQKPLGELYFFYYMILFFVLSVIILFGGGFWGMPPNMYKSLKKIRNIKKNKAFLYFTAGVILLFVSAWFVAITHYGYAQGGDKTVLPTLFYYDGKVTYLG